MQYALASLAFGLGASAAMIPRDTCTFTLTASGGQKGVLGQLGDGQNRVGGGLPTGTYSINNGQITDAKGRGCILTPPTTQFQCDVGATPTGGFSIGSNGGLQYKGSPTFYACPATDNAYNIYTTPVAGQSKCVQIQLTASGCYAAPATSKPAPAPQTTCPAPVTKTVTVVQQGPTVTVVKTVAPPAPVTTKVVPAPVPVATTPAAKPAPSAKTCPANLSGAYQYPHLIVPVSMSNANKAYGTSYNGKITSDVSSIYNFDIPASYTGTCSLVFLFPQQSQLQTSSFTFSGDGKFDFKQLTNVASQSTTYANQGASKDLGSYTATPGSSTVVSTFACPAGKAVSYEISAVSGSSLEYFQDYNPSPIGLYITSC